jgi:hypothetical protein
MLVNYPIQKADQYCRLLGDEDPFFMQNEGVDTSS